jgi:hypothetical protein
VYLVHQDGEAPDSLGGFLRHVVEDVTPAVAKRVKMREPFAKAGSVQGLSSAVAAKRTLEPGDILLTRAKDRSTLGKRLFAGALEAAQGTPYYHSAMYVGDGRVVHSRVGEGTVSLPLKKFHDMYDYRAYRVRAPGEVKQDAVSFMRKSLGRGYASEGLLAALVPSALVSEETPKEREAARNRDEFICSSLIAAAYPGKRFGRKSVSSVRPVDFASSPSTKLVAETKVASERSVSFPSLERDIQARAGSKDEGFSRAHAASLKREESAGLLGDPNGDDGKTPLKTTKVAMATTRGIYKGEPAGTDTVKFKVDFQGLPVQVERPRGFIMLGVDAKGKHWSRRYKYDYGHIPRTLGGDNDGLDVFLGPKKNSKHAFWAVQRKPDGSFDEYKVFLGFDNRDEAIAAYRAHIPKSLLAGMMTMRIEMMHAMLGKNPEQHLKVAGYRAMLHELLKEGVVKTELQPHQQRVVERMQREDQPGLVVIHGLGSGKTLTSIAAQEALGLPSQVVAPASLLGNYEKERAKHLEGKSQKAELLSMQNMAVKGLKPDAPLLIVDEAHRARDPSTATFQMLKGNTSQKRMLLSGSPFYNHPVDLAGLVDIAADAPVLPYDKKEFERRYVIDQQQKVPLGQQFLNIWRSQAQKVKPGTVPTLYQKNAPELRSAFEKWVDYHPGSTEHYPEVSYEDVRVPMSRAQLKMYDALMGQAPAWVAAKVKRGLPPTKQESKQLNAFLSAARQASNTTAPFHSGQAVPEEAKIDAAFQSLKKTLDENERAKAVVYSQYLEAGIDPYKKRLQAAGIPYGEFTGEMPMKARNQLVKDYNTGKVRTLLLSSAGGEGLDLQGTRLMQVLEPHWNLEKLKQVEGRGARYKSHEHLPPEERKLLVQRYLATRPEGLGAQLGKTWLGRDPDKAVDEYLYQLSNDKERLISSFRDLLPTHQAKTGAAASDSGGATSASTQELMRSWKPQLATHAKSTLPIAMAWGGAGRLIGGLSPSPHGRLLGAAIGGAAGAGVGSIIANAELKELVRSGKVLARKAMNDPKLENALREKAMKLDWGHGLETKIGPGTFEHPNVQLEHPLQSGLSIALGAGIPTAFAEGNAVQNMLPLDTPVGKRVAAVARVAAPHLLWGAATGATQGLASAYQGKYLRTIALNELENQRARQGLLDEKKLQRLKQQVGQLEDKLRGGWGKEQLSWEDLSPDDASAVVASAPKDRSGKDW